VVSASAGSVDVLIVEDEPAVAESTADILELAGFSVAVTPTVHEALEAVASSAVGCVILDHHLADESGETFLGAEEATQPTIVLSGMGQGELARLWHENADRLFACLPKPVQPEDLIEVVRSAVRPAALPAPSRPARPWSVGTWVYARDPHARAWNGGFAIVEVLDDGYRLRRLWEGDVLDDPFAFEDVRPERRHNPFR
jgi:DNA-binding NtrC family response regulator